MAADEYNAWAISLRPLDIDDPKILPEKALLLGILDRALRDAALEPGVDIQRHVSREAKTWLEDFTNKEPFSFMWICAELEMDPRSVLRLLYTTDRYDRPRRRAA